ncbi:AraC family transcriptional regulator [Frankia sp. R82]|uniref:AraC family transcriptional regulator n=1 Tax=Frankia sp. R82 TaxID=2950553 RepID=UPI0020446375|nr:AraC family transcriptional regulator [Frankia sp. R82]MCM3885517.1 AraC family transcriptional regulator [Frankia sp. R82]
MDVLSDAVTMLRAGRPHSNSNRLWAPWGIRFPPTDGAGFHIVLMGTCWLLRAGARPLRLAAGDIVLLPREPGHALADDPASPLTDFRADPHGPIPSEHADGYGGPGPGGRTVTELLCGAYMFDRFRLHPLLADLPDVIHLPARVGHHPRLRAAVDLLGAELAEPRAGAAASMSALLDLLLLYMLRAWFDDHSTGSSTGWSAALADPAVSAALRAMHAEPEMPWTVRELGARVGLSRTVFAQRFTALVGKPPLAYLTWWRMTMAARLLRETDSPLPAVARRCGYSSEFAFAKTFKREFGVPPGAFRREGRPPSGSPADASPLTATLS